MVSRNYVRTNNDFWFNSFVWYAANKLGGFERYPGIFLGGHRLTHEKEYPPPHGQPVNSCQLAPDCFLFDHQTLLSKFKACYTFSTVILFIATILFFHSASACNKDDNTALVAFMNTFPSEGSLQLYWTNTTDCCTWFYIGCDSKTGRVTSLDFSGYSDYPPAINFNGSIPAAIGDLSELTSINFDHIPGLVGPLPPQLTKLKKLQYLTISDTLLSGPVPSFLSQLPSLKQIGLYNNKLAGTIPPSLANLVHLTDITLYGNQLEGTIPESLFSKLEPGSGPTDLDVSSNGLTGTIPRSFADVPFNNINVYSNKLTGDPSFLFGKSKPAQQIIISFNDFAFDLTNVEYPEKNLQYVDISHNHIYGNISDQITQVPQLNTFDVSYNRLCGKIPSGGSLAKFPNPLHFFVHNKCLCGTPLPACK